jgi:hypothetical protein
MCSHIATSRIKSSLGYSRWFYRSTRKYSISLLAPSAFRERSRRQRGQSLDRLLVTIMWWLFRLRGMGSRVRMRFSASRRSILRMLLMLLSRLWRAIIVLIKSGRIVLLKSGRIYPSLGLTVEKIGRLTQARILTHRVTWNHLKKDWTKCSLISWSKT